MTNGDCEGRIMDYFSCSAQSTAFYIGKNEKKLPENPEYAENCHGDVILTLN